MVHPELGMPQKTLKIRVRHHFHPNLPSSFFPRRPSMDLRVVNNGQHHRSMSCDLQAPTAASMLSHICIYPLGVNATCLAS